MPINILDKRWYNLIYENQSKLSNKFLYARSIFLQGLLLNFDIKWPNISLMDKKNIKKNLYKICESMNYKSLIELYISYVMSFPQIKNITIGINNIKNFMECDKIFSRFKKMDENELKNIANLMPDLDYNFLNPQKWNK